MCVWSNASTSTATSGHRGSGIRSSLFLQMAYHLRALGHTKRHDYIVKQTGRTHNNDHRFILKILHNDKTMNYEHVPLSFGREMVQLKVYSPIYCKSEMERTHIRTAEYSRLTLRVQRFQTTLHNDDGRVRCKWPYVFCHWHTLFRLRSISENMANDVFPSMKTWCRCDILV